MIDTVSLELSFVCWHCGTDGMPGRSCIFLLGLGIVNVHLAFRQRILERGQQPRATPVVHHWTRIAAIAALLVMGTRPILGRSYGFVAREGRRRRS